MPRSKTFHDTDKGWFSTHFSIVSFMQHEVPCATAHLSMLAVQTSNQRILSLPRVFKGWSTFLVLKSLDSVLKNIGEAGLCHGCFLVLVLLLLAEGSHALP